MVNVQPVCISITDQNTVPYGIGPYFFSSRSEFLNVVQKGKIILLRLCFLDNIKKVFSLILYLH